MKENYIRVPYGSTVHGQEEIDAVVSVLKTSTQMGRNVEEFEKKVGEIFEKKYGVMTNSGTSALFLLMESLNIEKGSEVITPALTFGTTVSCILKSGLIPSFVDVKENTYCIDETKIEEKITSKTKAIVAPDLLGNICDWKTIRQIADKHNLLVLLDSADTIGSTLHNESTGIYADHAITSFYGSHIINGAGNGGMLVTSSDDVYEKAKLLRSWGRSSSLFKESESIENRFNVDLEGIRYDAKFIFQEPGYQLEPSEISAAFALVQFKKLKQNISLRQKHFIDHTNFFRDYEEFFILPNENEFCKTCWLAYPLIVKSNKYFNRTDMQIFLENRNIQTRVVFTGNILRQPMMKNYEFIGDPNNFVNADNVMNNGILLACHHGLTDEMKDHIYTSIELFLETKLKQ